MNVGRDRKSVPAVPVDVQLDAFNRTRRNGIYVDAWNKQSIFVHTGSISSHFRQYGNGVGVYLVYYLIQLTMLFYW